MLYDDALAPVDVVKRWVGLDNGNSNGSNEDEEEDEFFKKTAVKEEDLDDRMLPEYDYAQLEARWSEQENIEALRKRFASSKISKDGEGSDDEDSDAGSEFNGVSGSEDEGDGEFEDLETGETHKGKDDGGDAEDDEPEAEVDLEAERARNAKKKEELRLRFEEEDREGFANAKGGERDEQEFGEDEWYDAQKAKLQKQLDINRAEFDSLDPISRARAEGFKAGTYARIVLENVPCEFSQNFNPRFPVIVGGLAPTEDRFGF
ncbi:Glycoside hydrolase 2 (Mannanase, beta-galactosidase), partial [Ascosphaera atra]